MSRRLCPIVSQLCPKGRWDMELLENIGFILCCPVENRENLKQFATMWQLAEIIGVSRSRPRITHGTNLPVGTALTFVKVIAFAQTWKFSKNPIAASGDRPPELYHTLSKIAEMKYQGERPPRGSISAAKNGGCFSCLTHTNISIQSRLFVRRLTVFNYSREIR